MNRGYIITKLYENFDKKSSRVVGKDLAIITQVYSPKVTVLQVRPGRRKILYVLVEEGAGRARTDFSLAWLEAA